MGALAQHTRYIPHVLQTAPALPTKTLDWKSIKHTKIKHLIGNQLSIHNTLKLASEISQNKFLDQN